MDRSFVNALFYEEPAGTFSDGYVFRTEPDLTGAQQDPDNGYWHCDVADHDRLTWSEKVYELFGLPAGTPIERDWAVERYSEGIRLYRERAFKDARACFLETLAMNAADRPSRLYVERCEHVLETPPPADWDGVWTMTDK